MKELNYGETPWDNLSKDELLLEVKRMYSALDSSVMVLDQFKSSQKGHPYWKKDGTGGKAYEKCNQIMTKIHSEYDKENIFRSYFRYATDLLFDHREYKIGFNWVICPICGSMIGDDKNEYNGKLCDDVMPKLKTKNCNGIVRPIIWDDLKLMDSK